VYILIQNWNLVVYGRNVGYSKAFQGQIGYLLAGQSCCREQMISAHGWLERVLQADIRFVPLARNTL